VWTSKNNNLKKQKQFRKPKKRAVRAETYVKLRKAFPVLYKILSKEENPQNPKPPNQKQEIVSRKNKMYFK